MLRNLLAFGTLLGMATVVSAQSIGGSDTPKPIPWPFARKSESVAVEPLPGPVLDHHDATLPGPVPDVAGPKPLHPTRHPYSFIWSNTEEFFNRPVLFNQPVEPVKTGQWVWFETEYLLWKIRKGPLPVLLVTTGNTPVFPLGNVPMVIFGPGNGGGVLGNADTIPVFGLTTFDYDAFSGIRLQGGFWCDCEGVWSVQLGGFLTEENTERFDQASAANGAPLLARPFFDPVSGLESSVLVAAPGAFDGYVRIRSHSRLSGAEANLRRSLAPETGFPMQFLTGFRYTNLDEDLSIFQQTRELDDGQATFAGQAVSKNNLINLFDSFSASNRFYGGQVGLQGEWQVGSFVLGTVGKFALGGTVADMSVMGVSRLDRSMANQTSDVELGGMLAQPNNIHSTERSRFSFVGEVNVSVSYLVCSCCRISVGYDFLYWSDVVRPGSMVDRQVNGDAIVVSPSYGAGGPEGRPARRYDWSDFWATGVNFGLELRY